MTTGEELYTFITGLNAGASIDLTLAGVLVETARAIIEAERPWMVLRKTDSSKTVTTGNTWQTAIDLSTITRFSHFYGEQPIKLFDGNNRVEYYTLVPLDRRLDYKDVSNTAVYDENSQTLYLNGTVPFAGTLYIDFITESVAINLESASAVWDYFPSKYLPILGFYTVGIHMGGIDYDTITSRQAPQNLNVMTTLKNAMITWDNEKQLSSLQGNDPTDSGYPRSGAITRE